MTLPPLIATLTMLLAGCSGSSIPATTTVVVQFPSITPVAELPPLDCRQLEPPPVHLDPGTKFVGRSCTDPDGSVRWVNRYYQCTDGRVWPMLSRTRGERSTEPTGSPAFDSCTGVS